MAYQDIEIPTTFPQEIFQAFGRKPRIFFPELLSEKLLRDKLETRTSLIVHGRQFVTGIARVLSQRAVQSALSDRKRNLEGMECR